MLIVGHDRFLMYYGTELTSGAVLRWATGRLAWHYIEPGKQAQNAFIESYVDPARVQEQEKLCRSEWNSVAVVYPACLRHPVSLGHDGFPRVSCC